MGKTKTQATILIVCFMAAFSMGGLRAAYAKGNFTTSKPSSSIAATNSAGATGAGGNKVLSVNDVFMTLGDTISELIPDTPEDEPAEDEALAKAKKAAKKTAKPASNPSSAQTKDTNGTTTEEPDTIKAKRLAADEQPAKEKAEAASAPYKVYAAPVIEPEPSEGVSVYDEGTGQTYSTGRKATAMQSPSVSAAQPIDIKEPPPLPDYVKRDIQNGAVDPDATALAAKGQTKEKVTKENDIPSISSLPKQFFPVFPLGAGGDTQEQLLPVASNIEITTDHAATRSAIVFIHDIQRNSAEGVALMMTLAGSEEHPPLIMAPQFSLELDILRFAKHLPDNGRNVSRWSLEDPWQFGGESYVRGGTKGVSSFTALDLLLLFLTDKERFPSLEQVTVVGHGTGADFVHRYALLGQAPDILEKEKITTRFIVANASSYLYLTNMRPSGASGVPFKPVELKNCEKAASYPYGINDLNPYGKRVGANTIRMRFPERRILVMNGGSLLTDNYLDRGCEAAAQGKDRPARGQLYGRYVNQSFGEMTLGSQMFKLVPKAGYDPVAMFGSPCATAILFGTGTCN